MFGDLDGAPDPALDGTTAGGDRTAAGGARTAAGGDRTAGRPLGFLIRTDGAARGNPGPASLGAALYDLRRPDARDPRAQPDASISDYLGVQTNNVAEYTALLNGLRRAAELGIKEVEVVSDSELMVKQMRGEYKIKNAALRELSIEAARLARAVGEVRYTAVRRAHNKLADQLVNDALDAEH